jgi:lipopolysaccharide export system permease protein
MLKNKIYKYFTIEILKSFITILFALSAIAWTVRAVSFLDLVVENGHSVSTYLLFSLLNLTNIITKFIPLSFLIALLLSILKFEKQNELIILWTTGVSKLKIVNLFLFISIIVLLIQLSFAVFITPNSLNKSRFLIKSSNFDSVTSVIKLNDFTDSFKNLTFYVEKKNDLQEMENIFIRDESGTFNSLSSNSESSSNTTIIARTGIFKGKKLILNNGIIQSQNDKDKIEVINFKKTELSIENMSPRTIVEPKLQETKTSLLLQCIVNIQDYSNTKIDNCPKKGMKKDVVSTLSRRIGMPLYIPLVSLLCSFLLISSRKKSFNFIKRYIYFLLSFAILVLAEISVRFTGFSDYHTLYYFLFPTLLMPIVYLILFRAIKTEKKI